MSSDYHTRVKRLVGTQGTVSLPPSRLAGLKARLNGGNGGTVTLDSLGEQHGPYAGGTTYQRGQEPLIADDCVLTAGAGDEVILYYSFD